MNTSPAREARNRAGAARRAGPKSEVGRRRSAMNALKHGLRAEVFTWPEEQALIDARAAAWTEAERPATEVDAWLVAHVAAESVRIDRCIELESAAIDKQTRLVAAACLKKQRARARKRATKLADDPGGTVGRLLESACGCDWMIARWQELADVLEDGWWDLDE